MNESLRAENPKQALQAQRHAQKSGNGKKQAGGHGRGSTQGFIMEVAWEESCKVQDPV